MGRAEKRAGKVGAPGTLRGTRQCQAKGAGGMEGAGRAESWTALAAGGEAGPLSVAPPGLIRQPRRPHLAPAMPEQLSVAEFLAVTAEDLSSPGRGCCCLRRQDAPVPWAALAREEVRRGPRWEGSGVPAGPFLDLHRRDPSSDGPYRAPETCPFSKSLRTERISNIWVLPVECLGRRARNHLGGPRSHLDDRLPRSRDIPTMFLMTCSWVACGFAQLPHSICLGFHLWSPMFVP